MKSDDLYVRFTAFLKIVIIHAKLDYIRLNKKYSKVISLDDIEYEPSVTFEQQYDSYLEKHSFDFEENKLAHAFSELPLMKKRILEMIFIEELSPYEISAKLNCSVKFVYDQKYLAIKKLRIALESDNK